MFVNLPVKDLNRSVDFFTKLGYSFDPRFTDANATCMIIGPDSFVMLLVEKFFKTFSLWYLKLMFWPHPLVLDYSRVPFVKAVKNVTFVDGTPRDYSRKVPSPVFGFLGIPKALIGAVAPLPLQLKQTQISNLRADETLRKLRPAPAAET